MKFSEAVDLYIDDQRSTRSNARYLEPPIDDYVLDDVQIGIPLLDRAGAVRAHAWIDSNDLAKVWRYRWYLSAGGYARRSRSQAPRNVSMHRAIIGAPAAMEVDHVNGDRLDNRRANLRLATRRQNAQNVVGRGRSRHLGVGWSERRGKWIVQARVEGRNVFGGYFESEEAAAAASIELRERVGLWGRK